MHHYFVDRRIEAIYGPDKALLFWLYMSWRDEGGDPARCHKAAIAGFNVWREKYY